MISHVTDASNRLIPVDLVIRTRENKLATVGLNGGEKPLHLWKGLDLVKVISLEQLRPELFDLFLFVLRHPRRNERRDETVSAFSDVTTHVLECNLNPKPGKAVDPRPRMWVHSVDQCPVDVENHSLQHGAASVKQNASNEAKCRRSGEDRPDFENSGSRVSGGGFRHLHSGKTAGPGWWFRCTINLVSILNELGDEPNAASWCSR